VVKELLENALDAGATRIDVTVEDGGRKLVQVTDDGCGMGGEDLALAFAPHATSKIACEEDLFAIATMGFRGEALASVGSVSHSRIRSRPRDADGGGEVDAWGDAAGVVRPCAAGPGTTVTVRDLFYNTPARRKFMRTANTELAHVAEQLTRVALPHPRVAFTLTHNAREIRNLPAVETTLQRAGDLFGPELAEGLLPIVRRGGELDVAGLLGTPACARGSSKWQYFFLNGRYVRDRLLSHALREAFRGRADPNRWPVALLFLQIDPAEVDVNVHPTKVEVRFRNSQLVHGEVLAALTETLNRADLNPGAVVRPVAPSPSEAGAPGEEPPANEERQASLQQALADFFKSAPAPQPRLSFPESQVPHRPAASAPAGPGEPRPRQRAEAAETPEEPPAHEAAPPAPPRAIQIHNRYLVAAVPDGLIIVDQHALHERVLYNDLRARLAEGRLAGQRLLIPATFAVTAAEADLLGLCEDLLARLGIEVAPFGPDTMAVQQFPILLTERGVGPVAFLREMLDRLREDETTDTERLLEGILSVLACKGAVRAGDVLTPQEIDALLGRAQEAERASACPHGRPTTLRMTLADLEKQFRRT